MRVYYPGLDGLRAVAIALVYGFHDQTLDLPGRLMSRVELALIITLDPLFEAIGLPSASLWARILMNRLVRSNGWVGVHVFFVLSGFLITTLLLRERERFGRVDLRAFWVRRALRIWPLYYLTVAVGFGIYPWLREGGPPGSWLSSYGVQLPAFLGFLGNWSMATRGPLPEPIAVLWSICVEEQFYLFIPLLVAILGPRWRAAVVTSLIGLAVVSRYHMAASGLKEAALRYNSLANLDTLLAGVALALIAERRSSIPRPAWPWRVLVASGTVAVVAVPLCQGGPVRMALDQVLIWAWAAALVVVASSPEGRRPAMLRRPMIVWLGRISYGIYLFHELVMGLIVWLACTPRSSPRSGSYCR